MVRLLLLLVLTACSMTVHAQQELVNEFKNDKIGISFKYGNEFHLTESDDKSNITVSIGDKIGNTLNYGVSIRVLKKAAIKGGYNGFLEREREKYAAYTNEISESKQIVGGKYQAVEIMRTVKVIGSNIRYTIVELPEPNAVLTIYMVTEINPKFDILRKRTKLALKQYAGILESLVIYE